MPEKPERPPLIAGNLYKIRSRNLPYGVYDGQGRFIGIREKAGSLDLFTEYGNTVIALEDLGPAPGDLVLAEHLGSGPDATRNDDLYAYLAQAEQDHGRGTGYGSRPGDEED